MYLLESNSDLWISTTWNTVLVQLVYKKSLWCIYSVWGWDLLSLERIIKLNRNSNRTSDSIDFEVYPKDITQIQTLSQSTPFLSFFWTQKQTDKFHLPRNTLVIPALREFATLKNFAFSKSFILPCQFCHGNDVSDMFHIIRFYVGKQWLFNVRHSPSEFH